MAIVKFLRRNFVSILFPVAAITAIYIDYSHTQKWKKQLKLQN